MHTDSVHRYVSGYPSSMADVDFEPDLLDGYVSEERLEELYQRATPTAAELKQFTELYLEDQQWSERGAYIFGIIRLPVHPDTGAVGQHAPEGVADETAWLRAAIENAVFYVGSNSSCDLSSPFNYFDGPFASEQEAIETLTTSYAIEDM